MANLASTRALFGVTELFWGVEVIDLSNFRMRKDRGFLFVIIHH